MDSKVLWVRTVYFFMSLSLLMLTGCSSSNNLEPWELGIGRSYTKDNGTFCVVPMGTGMDVCTKTGTFTGHQRWIIATLYRSSGHWDVAREEFLKAYDAGYKNAFIMALTYDFKDAVTSCQLGREDLVKRYYDNLNELAENYPQENLNQIEQYKKNVVRIASYSHCADIEYSPSSNSSSNTNQAVAPSPLSNDRIHFGTEQEELCGSAGCSIEIKDPEGKIIFDSIAMHEPEFLSTSNKGHRDFYLTTKDIEAGGEAVKKTLYKFNSNTEHYIQAKP